jgi:hypothetical protein
VREDFRTLAYTTVMTLDRLAQEGLLASAAADGLRHARGRSARRGHAAGGSSGLPRAPRDRCRGFVDTVGEHDRELIAELDISARRTR